MKIIIAPDSFKGSLTAWEAAEAMTLGVRDVFPDAEIIRLPLADGGEGTVEVMLAAVPESRRVVCPVFGPLGSEIDVEYALLAPDFKTAVIEMAQASGLTLVPLALRNPLNTTTYGVGRLIADAITADARRLMIGLGGSATNDGGAGTLQALGVTFFDDMGNRISVSLHPMTGGDIQRVRRIVAPSEDILNELEIVIASDVTNPLTGPNGASAVFGPQKGATPEMVARLDADLTAFGALLDAFALQRGRSFGVCEIPGAGAAGGLGAALLAFFPQAAVRSGIEVVLEAVQFDRHLQDADLVLTGEGKLDAQTLSGKAICGVLRASRRWNVPVIAFAGVVADGAAEQLQFQGLHSAYALADLAKSHEDAMENAARHLRRSVTTALQYTKVKRMSTATSEQNDLSTIVAVLDEYLLGVRESRNEVEESLQQLGKTRAGWNMKRAGLEFGLPESDDELTTSLITLRLSLATAGKTSTGLIASLKALCLVSQAVHHFISCEIDFKALRKIVSQQTGIPDHEVTRILCHKLAYTLSLHNAPGADGKDASEVLAMCFATADRIASFWQVLLS